MSEDRTTSERSTHIQKNQRFLALCQLIPTRSANIEIAPPFNPEEDLGSIEEIEAELSTLTLEAFLADPGIQRLNAQSQRRLRSESYVLGREALIRLIAESFTTPSFQQQIVEAFTGAYKSGLPTRIGGFQSEGEQLLVLALDMDEVDSPGIFERGRARVVERAVFEEAKHFREQDIEAHRSFGDPRIADKYEAFLRQWEKELAEEPR